MKVHHTFFFFFFLTLRDGNTDLLNAEILDRTVTEGENITVKCSFLSKSGRMKFFCKKECEGKNILVQTSDDRAQSGRYSIEYKRGYVYVSISNLTKSDSGRYRCSLDKTQFPDSKDDFDIRVEDASVTSKPNWTLRPFPTSVPSASTLTTTLSLSSRSGGSFTSSSASPEATKQSQQQQTKPAAGPASVTSKPNWTLRPFPTSVPSASTLTTTQSLSSKSGGSFTSSSASPEATSQTQQQQTKPAAGPAQTTTGVLLYVGLILIVMIIVSSVAVLIFCRKRASDNL